MGTIENSTNLLTKLGIAVPIIQAPMAGWATPALAAAVSGAGALGSLGLGGTTAESARALIRETRSLTDRPFSVNVFCHVRPVADPAREARWLTYLKPHFARFHAQPPTALGAGYASFVDDDAMLTMLLEERPAVVSFHFGLPPSQKIAALRDAGVVLMATATNSDEAGQIAAAGIDAIVAQGIEAGGHRGMFDPALADERLGSMALVRLLLRETSLPVIAAGGIMDGACIAAMLALGVQAAQLGTAFLTTAESAANEADRAALLDRRSRTVLTRAISGRPARAIENHFTKLGQDPDCPPVPEFPLAFAAGKALNAAAQAHGSSEYAAQWAGQAVRLSRAMPAADLVAILVHEMVCSITSLSADSLSLSDFGASKSTT
ncbi:NAD(P)H-dependent flavin oxidoreductase [Paraburkholderia sp. WSM4174]|uniref:NAD(P)H-dependent flavin oxidoreductase n=1 Tax=Paraburkholderia sp. WSM4174 TaxID=2991071 RepID=UPI003D1E68B2